MIRRANPESKMLGIVPVPEPPLEYNFQLGLVVSREPEYSTIVHPGQDYCLLVHASPDQGVIWDAEYRFCLEFTQMLRRFGNFGSLLVAYNGGNTTAKEIVATAGLGLPVLLIDGSGGAAERYARDADFRTAHPNVVSCDATTASLRQALIAHHALAN